MEIWQTALNTLKLQMTRATFDTWLANTQLINYDEHTAAFTIGVANAYAKDWLEHRLHQIILRTLSRLTGKTATVQFTILYPTTSTTVGDAPGPSLQKRPLGETDLEPADQDLPADCRFGIELVSFDPTSKGWVMTSNYAHQFWQPYLTAIERENGTRSGGIAFPLWQLLRSFPASWQGRSNPNWPSIQTLADIVANGNRHKVLGRAACKGRQRTIGALETLEQARIVWTRTYGQDRDTIYYFRVLDNLPILTPAQTAKLTQRLQERHQREMSKCQIDYEQWQQLTLPTLLPGE